jgi:hypothetical protein
MVAITVNPASASSTAESMPNPLEQPVMTATPGSFAIGGIVGAASSARQTSPVWVSPERALTRHAVANHR